MSLVESRSIRIRLGPQILEVLEDKTIVETYSVSTSARGGGECFGSEHTPRGRHYVREMIGGDLPTGSVFVARQPTGEMCSTELRAANPGRDWIVSRIIWLGGLETGRNRGGQAGCSSR